MTVKQSLNSFLLKNTTHTKHAFPLISGDLHLRRAEDAPFRKCIHEKLISHRSEERNPGAKPGKRTQIRIRMQRSDKMALAKLSTVCLLLINSVNGKFIHD